MDTTSVKNLRTGMVVAEYTCKARAAVIAAFAQFAKNDHNTWDYETKYGKMVEIGQHFYFLGDYAARR